MTPRSSGGAAAAHLLQLCLGLGARLGKDAPALFVNGSPLSGNLLSQVRCSFPLSFQLRTRFFCGLRRSALDL